MVHEIKWEELQGIKPEDRDLAVQMVACDRFEGSRHSAASRDAYGRTLVGSGGKELENDLCRAAADAEEGLLDGGALCSAGMRAWVLVPVRMELLEGGPCWLGGPRRVEWSRQDENQHQWVGPRRILPYSPPTSSSTNRSSLTASASVRTAGDPSSLKPRQELWGALGLKDEFKGASPLITAKHQPELRVLIQVQYSTATIKPSRYDCYTPQEQMMSSAIPFL